MPKRKLHYAAGANWSKGWLQTEMESAVGRRLYSASLVTGDYAVPADDRSSTKEGHCRLGSNAIEAIDDDDNTDNDNDNDNDNEPLPVIILRIPLFSSHKGSLCLIDT
ncbi:hypothetical protein M0804_001567 [Polistes exclamans]|nr:hypothetical protein M0804_001567 [Polistes exclamans]